MEFNSPGICLQGKSRQKNIFQPVIEILKDRIKHFSRTNYPKLKICHSYFVSQHHDAVQITLIQKT